MINNRGQPADFKCRRWKSWFRSSFDVVERDFQLACARGSTRRCRGNGRGSSRSSGCGTSTADCDRREAYGRDSQCRSRGAAREFHVHISSDAYRLLLVYRPLDPLLRRSFQAGGRPVRSQVGGCLACPWVTTGDRSFPSVLARTWHATFQKTLCRPTQRIRRFRQFAAGRTRDDLRQRWSGHCGLI